MIKANVRKVHEVINTLPGVTCQPVEGGAFAFPRVFLPTKAVQKAKVILLSDHYTLCVQVRNNKTSLHTNTSINTNNCVCEIQELGMEPDTFYCVRLLEETGAILTPGCEYGQKEGTHHIRFCITAPSDTIEMFLRLLVTFHTQFMEEFS